MLVQMDGPDRPTSALHSIMDSPTLARVERAMLRHEHPLRNHETVSLNRSVLAQVSFVFCFWMFCNDFMSDAAVLIIILMLYIVFLILNVNKNYYVKLLVVKQL